MSGGFSFVSPTKSSAADDKHEKGGARESIKEQPGMQTLKRAQNLAELSKTKRDANFNKRRRPHEAKAAAEALAAASGMSESKEAESEAATHFTPEQVSALIAAFSSSYVQSAPAAAGQAPGVGFNPAVPAAVRHQHLQSLRQLVSHHEDEASIEAVVAAGIVPLLILELSAPDQSASSQMDVLWCLTNIASDSTAHTRAVMPAAPALISLMSSASVKVQEQCVWCLGNLASEEENCRRALMAHGILVPLLRILAAGVPSTLPPPPLPVPVPDSPGVVSLLRVATWTLSNLVKSSRSRVVHTAAAGLSHAVPAGASFTIDPATGNLVEWTPQRATDPSAGALGAFGADLPRLLFALLRSADEQLATEAAWVVASWANKGDEVMREFFRLGFHEALLSRLAIIQASPMAATQVVIDPVTQQERDPLAPALIPLVRVLGNVSHADDALVQTLLGYQFAPVAAGQTPPNALHLVFSSLERSLRSIHRGLRKEVCWVLANLAGTSIPLVHEALGLSGANASSFLRLMVEMLPRVQFDVQREVLHALYNFARMGQSRLMHVVLPRVAAGETNSPTQIILGRCFDCLRGRDGESILLSLRLIELMLRVHPDGANIVQHEGGIDALEAVQQSTENAELVAYAHKLNDEFFGEDRVDDDEADMAGQTQQQDSEYPEWRLQHQTPPRAGAGLNNNAAASAATPTTFQFYS